MRYYFREDDEDCHTLEYHYDYMQENGIKEMEVFLAKVEIGSEYFFCKFYGEVGERAQGTCGKCCEAYKPRSKKWGICKHYGYVYERTDRRLLLELEVI